MASLRAILPIGSRRSPTDMKGFVVMPRRWVVERTFSWFGRNRRLAKDFENLAETLATFVTLASIPTGPQAARQGVGRDGGGPQSIVKMVYRGGCGARLDAEWTSPSVTGWRSARPRASRKERSDGTFRWS